LEEPGVRSAEERIEALERAVEELRQTLRSPPAPAAQPVRRLPPAPKGRRIAPALLEGGDPWRWIGIGLLLFGVAFLFKYSIDRGWLTPPVRVGFGLVIASVLLAISDRLAPERRSFARVLDGGAVATLYISGFAAFQLYALVPHAVAFAFLVGVTLLAFWLSLRSGDAALSVIGVAGGLGTPFLLQQEHGSIPGLVAYTCVVLAGAGAIYFRRGWSALLGVAAILGWLVLGLAIWDAAPTAGAPSPDRVALQLGIGFAAFQFWGLPLLRWRKAVPVTPAAVGEAYVSAVTTPLVALALSSTLWELPRSTWGWIALGLALALGGVARLLARATAGRPEAPAQSLSAFVLLAVALALLLDGSWLLVAIAAEGMALHRLAFRAGERLPGLVAHALFAFVFVVVAQRLSVGGGERLHLLSGGALSDLFAIGAAAWASTRLRDRGIGTLYRFGAHVAFLAWLARGLSGLENGQGIVTIAWGAFALILLLLGLRRDDGELRTAGRLTLFGVVAKLFLVDLGEVETLWRIVSFLGFGAAFLALSYWLRDLWKPSRAA
jgi:uncharacterized membrane protein